MKRFVEGIDRRQATLFPECLEDWIDENNPVQVIDVFVDALDLAALGFDGVAPEATGRPSYHPCVLLKLYIYGYLNRVQSSRRLEREALRNVEVMWLGATHFLMKHLPKVATEMALHVLAYNLTRVINILGVKPLMVAIRA
jgi:transposase